MLGTIVNTACIVVGSVLGAVLKKGIKPHYQHALYNAMGLCAVVLGMSASLRYMPKSNYPVLFIVCMALGALMGFMMDLSGRFNRLVDRFNNTSTDPNASHLGQGLSTGILLYCIGPLSMLGPVISALQNDHTYLFTNATLDIVTSMVLASTYGIGMIWAAPVLFLWQSAFYLTAKLSATAISDDLITELSIVGGILITSSGLAILGIKDCKTLNLLPALLLPILFFAVKGLF